MEDLPFFGAEVAVAGVGAGVVEGLAGGFGVDAGEGVVKFVFVFEPDAADFAQFCRADQLDVLQVGGGLAADGLLGFEEATEEVFAVGFEVGAGDVGDFLGVGVAVGALEEVDAAADAAEVAVGAFAIAFLVAPKVEFVAKVEEGLEPVFAVVVEDHGFHGFVAIDEGADPAAKAGAATTGGAGIDDEGAFVVGGGAAIDLEEFLVGVAPGVGPLHEVEPHLIVGPVFDGAVDEGVGQAGVGAEPVAQAFAGVFGYGGGAFGAFGFAGAEDEDGVAVFADDVADEAVGGVDFQALGAPAKFLAGGGVAFADEVDPEGVFELGGEGVGLEG